MQGVGRRLYRVTMDVIPSLPRPPNNNKALIVWWDTVRELDSLYFQGLLPGQVVNRIPNSNLLCRKTSFVRLIQRLESQINIHSFIPRSFVLPSENDTFLAFLDRHTCIVKPDDGALGSGIVVLDRRDSYQPNSALYVAQEYIDTRVLYRGYKFDLRVYAVAVFTPADDFQVYVYREGIARVCSEKYGGMSDFARLTNTAVNRRHPDVKMEDITKMMSQVFQELPIETERLWRRIDRVIAMSVISAIGFISKGIQESGQGFATFFQLFGFDILLDTDLRPKVLEVNYRPSLCSDIADERQLKREMIVDTCLLVLPKSTPEAPQLSESWGAWQRFTVENTPTHPGFVKILPDQGKRQQRYHEAIKAMRQADTAWDPKMPTLKVPAKIAVHPAKTSNSLSKGTKPVPSVAQRRSAVARQPPG
jgi:hypothetical protein